MDNFNEDSWQHSYIKLLDEWYINKRNYILRTSDEDTLEKDLDELDEERITYIERAKKASDDKVNEDRKQSMSIAWSFIMGASVMFIPLYIVLSNM